MLETLRSAFEHEITSAVHAEKDHDFARAWCHLERAHVLSQAYAWDHLCVHARMFSFALRRRDVREVLGQGRTRRRTPMIRRLAIGVAIGVRSNSELPPTLR